MSTADVVTGGCTRGGVGNSFGVMMMTSATRISARTVRLSIYVVNGSGHRIIATWSEWMTTTNSFCGEDRALPCTVPVKSFECILRATRIVPTGSRKEGPEKELVRSDDGLQHTSYHDFRRPFSWPVIRSRKRPSASRKSSKVAVYAAGRAQITRSPRTGAFNTSWRTISRMRRFRRLRSTAV